MRLLWVVVLLIMLHLIADLATAQIRPRPGDWKQCRKFHLSNGKVKLMSRGRLANLSCKRGYNMVGGDRILQCVWKMWIGIKPMCIRGTIPSAIKKCTKFHLENGKVKLKFKGQLASLSCKRGYTMTGGDQFLGCVRQRWDGILPKCISTAVNKATTPVESSTTTASKEISTIIPVSESLSTPAHMSTISLSSPSPITVTPLEPSVTTPLAWEDNPVLDPDCQPIKHLVNLGLPKEVGYRYSVTHTFIVRCRGFHEKRACVATVEKETHLNVQKTQVGVKRSETLKISYNIHDGCKYDMSICSNPKGKLICQANHLTHYWDEKTCECQCFVKINDEDSCTKVFNGVGVNYGGSSYENVYTSNRGSFVGGGYLPVAPSYSGGSYGGDHDVFGVDDYDGAGSDVVDGYNRGSFNFGGGDYGGSSEVSMQCKMGDISLELGATLKMNQQSNCDRLCSCNIPPEFTCDIQSKCDLAEVESIFQHR